MKKWPYLLALAIIFIGINLFLLEKKDSKVAQLHFVPKWDMVKKESLVQSFSSNGVVIPSETHHVYIDKEAGFNQFLVKEGDVVETGTPLFEYSTSTIEKQQKLLDAEIERLEKEIESIDASIQNLEAMLSSAEIDEKASEQKDDQIQVVPKTASYSIKLEINDKELTKEKLEQRIDQYNDQKSGYNDEASNLTIVSDTAGIVKKVAYDLNNPVITIVSSQPIIQGYLSEQQQSKVKSGMQTLTTTHLIKGKMKGVIEKVGTTPKNDPDVDKQSVYPYEIALDKPNPKLQVGYHVKSNIITKEIKDAKVIQKNSVVHQKNKEFIWSLDHGQVKKKEIQKGLQVDKNQQIKDGANIGDLYITNPHQIKKPGEFITSLKITKIDKQAIKTVGLKSSVKYILIGLLQK
ncbi:efflux RND transporter periplasmic adaptor subunit [Heyndrickxia oleronia]|uniref:efflux RND transporter periplasmic adaptor subunit n=1 Tax=Heyndrickxia oleronia TaxID=38875 RepID=UPI0037502505